MSIFVPATKREGRGKQQREKMWERAGLRVLHHTRVVWGFRLHPGCFPPGALSHSHAAVWLNIKRSSNREPETQLHTALCGTVVFGKSKHSPSR